MKPPYDITQKILQLVASISEKLGVVNAANLHKPPTQLRKKNRIKTIQASLEIEGNTLSEEQITALIEDKRVIAPEKDILEVQNAIQVYQKLHSFNPFRIKDLERAHLILMKGLISDAGKLRSKNVGIIAGSQVKYITPSGKIVKGLVNDLLQYLKKDKDLVLIKSCVFHYEFEFIHPFMDGNGRMGRLWQTLILIQEYPLFEYLPVESIIKEDQAAYYRALSQSDQAGHSTPFIEYMLAIILQSLKDLLESQNRTFTIEDRIELYKDKVAKRTFSRKDYLRNFRNISQATASRDLKWAVEQNILVKSGEKRMTVYRYV